MEDFKVVAGSSLEKLIEQFKPVIYLYPHEPYMPVDFRSYLKEARLKSVETGKDIFSNIPFNADTFGEWLMLHPHLNSPSYTLYLPSGKNSDIVESYNPDAKELENVPLYVRARREEESVYLTYAHMYAYNADQPCWNVGGHFADLEHITVHVKFEADGTTAFVHRVYYSRHNGGVWCKPEDLEFENGQHPVVYSALGSHASYNKEGNHSRFWNFARDRCSKGTRWFSKRPVLIKDKIEDNSPDMRWSLFSGDLGDGHVAGFPAKQWWNSDDLQGNYGNGCNPFKWHC